MDQDRLAADRLLSAWLTLTSSLWNTRLVTSMTFNEAHVLGLLLRHISDAPMTATDLVAHTRLLKSQMNKLITTLEGKGFIARERSESDRRMIYIRLTPEGKAAYLHEHAGVDSILDQLIERIGAQRASAIADELNAVTQALTEIIR